MKVSIITVAFNAEATIKDTIESVLSQDYDQIEYIIVDGKSSDSTMDIVNSYGNRISKVISEKDKGLYDAMNKGVGLATGDLIGILNADDVYQDQKVISDIVDKIGANDAVYADLQYVAQDDLTKVTRTWISGNYQKDAFKKGWMPPHPTFFVKSKVYELLGKFTLELRSSADYEFMLRVIHKHQISVAYLPRVIVKMRVGGESNASLKNRLRANKEDRKAWEMNGLKAGKLTFFRKPLSKVGQFFKK